MTQLEALFLAIAWLSTLTCAAACGGIVGFWRGRGAQETREVEVQKELDLSYDLGFNDGVLSEAYAEATVPVA